MKVLTYSSNPATGCHANGTTIKAGDTVQFSDELVLPQGTCRITIVPKTDTDLLFVKYTTGTEAEHFSPNVEVSSIGAYWKKVRPQMSYRKYKEVIAMVERFGVARASQMKVNEADFFAGALAVLAAYGRSIPAGWYINIIRGTSILTPKKGGR
jgi:hypothetical protein